MTGEAGRYARLHMCLGRARELEGHARTAYLDAACEGDAAFRAEVEELIYLADRERPDLFDEEQIGRVRGELEDVVDDTLASSHGWVPDVVAGFEIQGLIGAGGMGVVYEAIQRSPRRRVAVKLLHPLYVRPDGLKRFQQEAQLMGRLRHPGIAQVLDAGVFKAQYGQQPYYAMELVEGADLLTFCKDRQLGARARLELFARVCDAVEFAHRGGVIHRDLKPDNVLVDEHGEPKVLDFGIATARGTTGVLSTVVTQEGQLVGTLAYMAPEQLSAGAAGSDHRVDVYALGVLAFELLTGELPRDVSGLSVAAAVLKLVAVDPPRAGDRDEALRGDVETILLAALATDPARRYGSAAELSSDVRRFLEHRPIAMKRTTLTYRLRKLAQRNRVFVGGAAATLLALVAGAVAAGHFAGKFAAQRELAGDRALGARKSELRAQGISLQRAQMLYEAGEFWDAASMLAGVARDDRGWPWRLLDRALPNRLDLDSSLAWLWAGESYIFALDARNDRVIRAGVVTGEKEFLVPGEGVHAVARATHDGLAMATTGDEALLIDILRGKIVDRFPATGAYVSGWMAGPGGRVLLIPRTQERCELWVDSQLVREFEHEGSSLRASLSPDGRWVLHHSPRGIAFYNAETGDEHHRIPPAPPGTREYVFPLTGDAALYHTAASEDAGGRALRRCEIVADGLEIGDMDLNEVETSMTRQPLDGRFIVPSKGGETRPLDTRTGLPVRITHLQAEDGTLVFQKPSPSHWAYVSPLGSRLLIRGRIRAPWVLELDSRSAQDGWDPRRLLLDGHDAAVDTVAVSHDGSLLASASVDEALVRIWDLRGGQSVSEISLPADEAFELEPLVGFSADDERLLAVMRSAKGEYQMLEWTLRSGEVQKHRSGAADLSEAITRLVSLTDPQPGDRFAAGLEVGRRETIALASALDGAIEPVRGLTLLDPPPGDFELQDLSLHPNGGLTAVVHDGFRNPLARYQVSMQGSLMMLDPATGEVVHDVPLERGLFRVAYSPCGEWLAIGTRDGYVQIVEARFYTLQLEFVAHAAQVSSLVWTPDGEQLVSASADGEIAVWDPSGELLDRKARDAWRARRQRGASKPLKPSRSAWGRLDRSAARIEALRAAVAPRVR